MTRTPAKGTCRAPGCDRPAQTRGICKACYLYFRKHQNEPNNARVDAIAGVIAPPRAGSRKAAPAGSASASTPATEADVSALVDLADLADRLGLLAWSVPTGVRLVNPGSDAEVLVDPVGRIHTVAVSVEE